MSQLNVKPQVRVWDLPVRLFHWSLVGLFIFLIVSGELGDDLIEQHFYAGYLLSGLIIFRVLWGFTGSRYARFRAFVRNPLHTLAYTKRMLLGNAEHYYGHNPAGAIMVVALLLLLALQVATGLVTSDDVIWDGPFLSAVSDETAELGATLHHQIQLVLKVFVGLHIVAIIFHRVRYKDALVPAMIHGRKADMGDAIAAEPASPVAFLLCSALAAGWVYYLFSLPL